MTPTLTTFNDIADNITAYHENPSAYKGKSTGSAKLDELITFKEGGLVIVTGIPSSGKSELRRDKCGIHHFVSFRVFRGLSLFLSHYHAHPLNIFFRHPYPRRQTQPPIKQIFRHLTPNNPTRVVLSFWF